MFSVFRYPMFGNYGIFRYHLIKNIRVCFNNNMFEYKKRSWRHEGELISTVYIRAAYQFHFPQNHGCNHFSSYLCTNPAAVLSKGPCSEPSLYLVQVVITPPGIQRSKTRIKTHRGYPSKKGPICHA